MRRLLVAMMITLAATAVSAKPGAGDRFNAWLGSAWEETLVRRPILAIRIGDPRYNDRIIDFTAAAWRADSRRFLERQLSEFGVLTGKRSRVRTACPSTSSGMA